MSGYAWRRCIPEIPFPTDKISGWAVPASSARPFSALRPLPCRAEQLFRQCILARVAEQRAGAECVVRLSRLAADMRSRGSGWTAIRDERLSFKEVCRELLVSK